MSEVLYPCAVQIMLSTPGRLVQAYLLWLQLALLTDRWFQDSLGCCRLLVQDFVGQTDLDVQSGLFRKLYLADL